MKRLVTLLALISLLSACDPEIKVVDRTDKSATLLVSDGAKVSKTLMPDGGIISEDVYLEANSEALPEGEITKIAAYRSSIFIFQSKSHRITVVDRNTFVKQATIDFSEGSLEPSDICFPNATDAYVSCMGSDIVALVDMTNFTIARKIKVGSDPVAITCRGNQIFTANRGDGTVSIIDSRTHNQEAVIPVGTAPSFIDVRPDGREAVVLAIGAGKIKEEGKTAPALYFINVDSRAITAAVPLAFSKDDAASYMPTGLAISSKDWIFIPLQNRLLRIDAKNRNKFFSVVNKKTDLAFYDKSYDRIITVSNTDNSSTITARNVLTGTSVADWKLNRPVRLFLPY
ncbi:MAG: YncE family protein [Chloroflexota bacterium]